MISDNFSHPNERGQSLTELAIVMSFLLVLLAGVVDIGRAFFTYIELRDAAQEGALVGSIGPTDCSAIIDKVKTSSNNLEYLINNGSVTVSCDIPILYCAGNAISVAVSYDNFPLSMPFLGTLIGSQTVNLSASIIDTIITNDPDETCP